jgi:monoamine oxidase
MGPVVKVVLRLRPRLLARPVPGISPPTALADVGFLMRDGLPFPTWWLLRPLRANVIVGWASGPVASALDGLDDAELSRRALASLAMALSVPVAELDGEVEALRVFDWQRDPFARGAYSWARLGGGEAPRVLARPVRRTLVFAGEAANVDGFGGTVHGALASGRHAAERVLALLGR